MRNILVDLSRDRQDAVHLFGGFEGEHNATTLSVILPERMMKQSDGEYRFVFETAKKEVIFSAPIEPEDGVLSVSLVKNLTLAPRLTVYVGCYRYENGAPVQIFKSGQIVLGMKNPEEGEAVEWNGEGGCVPGIVMEDSVLPHSQNPVKSRVLYAALEEKIPFSHVTDKVSDISKAGEKIPTEKAVAKRLEDFVPKETFAEEVLAVGNEAYTHREEFNDLKNLAASAVSTTKTGNPLRLDDISPIEHEMKVSAKVTQRYEIGTLLASKEYAGSYNLETDKYYTVLYKSIEEQDDTLSRVALLFSEEPLQGWVTHLVEGANEQELAALKNLKAGDVLYYGMLDGEAGLYYTKAIYFDSMTATVQRYGKNLLPYPYRNTTKTESGISFTDNGDGTVTANGTAEANAIFYCASSVAPIPLKKGTYIISGVPSGENANAFAIQISTSSGKSVNATSASNPVITLDADDNINFFTIVVWEGYTANNVTFKPMLEVGTTPSEYEPYKAPVTYTSDENGNVKGVTSLYPTTTLIAEESAIIAVQYNTDAGEFVRELSERIESAETGLEAVKKSGEKLQTDLISQLEDLRNSVSNVLKGTAKGKALTISDVSPVEHVMKVSVNSKGSLLPDGEVLRYTKNYIPSKHKHPVGEKTTTYGVVFVDNGDNTITANGKNSGGTTSNYYPYDADLDTPIPAGNYILYGCGAGDKEYTSDEPFKVRLFLWDEDGNKKEIVSNLALRRVKFTLEKPVVRIQVRIQVMQGVEVKNQTLYTFLFNEDDEETYDAGFSIFTKTNEVPSAYPEVYLLPKEEGSTVNAEYNRDINKAFAALSAAILNT